MPSTLEGVIAFLDLLIMAARESDPPGALHPSTRYTIALAQNAREAIVKVERLAEAPV